MSEHTTSTAKRHKYTNDALAFLLVGALVAAVGASIYLTWSVPRSLADVFAVESLLAATWAFGRETLTSVAEAWGSTVTTSRLRCSARTPRQANRAVGVSRRMLTPLVALAAGFPLEAVLDGAVFGPHHLSTSAWRHYCSRWGW